MPRGSSTASEQGSSSAQEMLGTSGNIQNTGKYTIRKKFYTSALSDLTQVPTPPSGFRATSINWRALGGGAYEQEVDYEYQVSSMESSLVETSNGVEGRFELDVQDDLLPLAAHPNIRKIVEQYSGIVDPNTGKVTFPPTYTPKNGSGGLGGGGEGSIKTNPMAGKLYYTKPAATFRHIQQTSQIPTDIWSNVGKKVSALPAGFPSPPSYTNDKGEEIKYYWIVMSPQIYRRGGAYEIVRSYKLSEPGAPDELYKLDEAKTNKS